MGTIHVLSGVGVSYALLAGPTQVPAVLTAPSYTGTLGGTLTAIAGTFTGATSVVTDFLANYAPNTGATLDSSQYLGQQIIVRSTASNGYGNTVALSAAGIVPGEPGLSYTYNPSGKTNGTTLISDGWTAANGGDSTMSGVYDQTNLIYNSNATSASAVNFLYKDTGSYNHAIEWTYAGSPSVIACVGYLDWNNHIRFNINTTGATYQDYGLYTKVAGVYTLVAFANLPLMANGDVVRLEIIQGFVRCYFTPIATGIRSQYSLLASQPNPTGAPPTGTVAYNASALTLGTAPGFVPNTHFNCGTVRVYNLTLPWATLSASDTVASSGPIYPTAAGRTVYLSGTYTGAAPTGIDVGFITDAGVLIAARRAATSFTAANGGWTLTTGIPELGSTYDGVLVHAVTWAAGAATNTGSGAAITLGAFASVGVTKIAINTGFNTWYDTEHRFRDLVKSSVWTPHTGGQVNGPKFFQSTGNADPTILGMGIDMIPHQFSGSDTYLTLPMCNQVLDVVGTTYTITHNMTGSTSITQTGWPGTAPLTQVDANHWTFTIPSGGLAAYNPSLNLYGTIPSPAGLQISILPNDGLGAQVTNPTFKSDIQALTKGPIRFMTELFTNVAASGTLSAADVAFGKMPRSGTSLADIVALCNECNRDLWFNVHHQADSSYWTAAATYIYNNLNSGLKCYIERSNEVWNTLFPQFFWSSRAAYNLGYANGMVAQSATPFVASSGRIPGANYASGAKVFTPTSGTDYDGVWVAQQSITSGDASAYIPTTAQGLTSNSAYWFYEAGLGIPGQNSTLGNAQTLYIADQDIAIFAAFYSVFGASAPTRLRRCVMGWQIQEANLFQKLSHNNLWQVTDIAGASSYTGGSYKSGGVTYKTAALANSSYSSNLSASMSLADLEAFKVGYFAQYNAEATYTVLNTLVPFKHRLEQDLRTLLGYVPNAIVFGSYEGGTSMTTFTGAWPTYLSSTTVNGVAGVNPYAELRKDARWGTNYQTFCQLMHDNIGGVHCLFDYGGAINVNPYNSSTGLWNIVPYTGATSDPGYVGIAAYQAANP
jgi:hypothetical protein